MAKNILFTLLIASLISACISIKPTVQASSTLAFTTATLAPTKAEPVPATKAAVPETSTLPALTVTLPANCTNIAILLRDVTIPDNTRVKAGETFTKTWEFQNMGTCPWTNYTIQFPSGDALNASLSTPIPDTLPNNTVQVSVELTAPTTDGRYTGYFALLNSRGEIVPIGTEKTFWVNFIVGTYTSNLVSQGTIPLPSGNCIFGPNANYVNEIVALINTERTNAGLTVLTFNADIATFAQHHAEDMAYNNFLSHDGTDGTFSERMRNSSIGIFSEILAIGTPQNAMDQWRRDEHWDFVLNAGATQIGVGYAYNSCSDYGGYFTVDFQ